MNYLLSVLLLLGCAWAQTTTPNIGLFQPPYNYPHYDVPINNDLSIIDNIFSIPTCADSSHAVGWDFTLKKLTCQTFGLGVLLTPTANQNIVGNFGLFFAGYPGTGKFGFFDAYFQSLGNHTMVCFDGDINNINCSLELGSAVMFGAPGFDTLGLQQGDSTLNTLNLFRFSDATPTGLAWGLYPHSSELSEDDSCPGACLAYLNNLGAIGAANFSTNTGATGIFSVSGATSGMCTWTTESVGVHSIFDCPIAVNSLHLQGNTSGFATITAPAVAGTTTNPIAFSNVINLPIGSFSANQGAIQFGTSGVQAYVGGTTLNFQGTSQFNIANDFSPLTLGAAQDAGISRCGAAFFCFGQGAQANATAFIKSGNTVSLSADWTCGTGGTVSSCVAAQIIGSTATPLTFTLPLVAKNWSFECDLVVGQATAVTANQWNILTATNGATSTTASYTMATAATAFAAGAVTDQASTTTTFQIAPSWTLGGTATKMPVHIAGTLTGASASGTVFSLQLVAPTVGDLVTIYQGSKCSINP